MIISYDSINVNAHIASGLLEDVNFTKEQKQELSNINFLIENLRKDISAFYKKIGVKSAKEAMKKADKDEEFDNKVRDWMIKVFSTQTSIILKLVDDFNRKYNEGYNKLISKKQGD